MDTATLIVFLAGLGAGAMLLAVISLLLRQRLVREAASLQSRNALLVEENNHLQAHLLSRQEESVSLNRQAARLESENRSLQERINSQGRQMEELYAQMKLQFENMATRMLSESTEQLERRSMAGITQLLDPLKERLKDFEEKVRQSDKESHEQTAALREQILMLRDMGMQMSQEARNLTQALKGDNKKQGNWGELILERVLETAGLREGREYILQAKGMGIRTEEGARQIPDVIVQLPRQRHIVIDAKVSLTAYEEWLSADEDAQMQQSLRRHVDSVKKHIHGLSERYYQVAEELQSPDFVLLFLPIEASLSLTLQADNSIFDYAWGRRIVLVSPTTLLATLKTVASVWKYEKQNANAMEIARMGGLLYDQFTDFVNEMDRVKKGLDGASSAYDEAMKRLVYNNNSLVRRSEKLRNLGVKNKKLLRPDLMEDETEELDS